MARDGAPRVRVRDIGEFGQFSRGANDDTTELPFYTVTPTVDTTMTDYVRGSGGQWPLDLNGHDEPTVDLVLTTPHGPYHIRVEITVDGLPFRKYQEKGIQSAVDALRLQTIDDPDEGSPTKIAEEAVDVPSDETSSTVAKDEPVDETLPRVRASSYRRSDIVQKLTGYLRSQTPMPTKVPSDDEELQWMVSQWLPGGRLLIASPKFGLQHSRTSVLGRLLSADGATLTAEEIEDAAEIVRAADRDGNDVVTMSELDAAAKLKASFDLWNSKTLLSLAEPRRPSTPDIELTIRIDEGQSVCVVDGADDKDLADRIEHETPFGRLVLLPVMDKRTGGSFFTSGQFSFGAMLSPDPLFRFADTRADGQLDTREISQLPNRLRSLDKNSDREITRLEIPMTVTLVVSQGPWANRLLTQIGGRKIPISSSTPTVGGSSKMVQGNGFQRRRICWPEKRVPWSRTSSSEQARHRRRRCHQRGRGERKVAS